MPGFREETRDMTSIVYDFDAIRPRMLGAELLEPTAPTPLAALIAEERRAWAAQVQVCKEADVALFAWREANPDLDEETNLPASIVQAQEKADAMAEAASVLTE